MSHFLKLLIWILLCGIAFGQGVTILRKTTILPKTTIFPGTSGGATAALLQHPSVHCTGSFSTCSLTLTQSITAGSILVFGGDVDSGHGAATITSINVGGSFVSCSSCTNASGTAMAPVGGWVLSATGTAGPVVISYSATINGSHVEMREYSCSGGTASADVSNNRDSSTDTTPYNGVTLSPAGTNDVIVQWSAGVSVDPTSVGAPYGTFDTIAGSLVMADRLNTNSGTAPAWTAPANSGGDTNAAIAMKCQ